MKNPVVRIKIRVRLEDGRRPFVDPVWSANHKLKPLYAVIDDQAVHRPEGVYFLRYARRGKRVWENVGSDAQLALIAKLKCEKTLAALAAGVAVVGEEDVTPGTLLSAAITEYLDEVKAAKSRKTLAAYSLTLKVFSEAVAATTLEDVKRKDVLAFIAALRHKRCSPRTVANRVAYLKIFFHRFELKLPMLKTDRVKFTDVAVAAYSTSELSALFAAATPEEYELFQFFLCTGARDQEVQFACWPDLDLNQKTFTVREKLDLGFRPKDKEEGSIPLPDRFIEMMRKRKARSSSRLIFPAAGGVEVHFLRVLKRLALKAGINCGQCRNRKGECCVDTPTCSHFILHRLRKTFATMHHENGVSVRSIQRFLRHSSLDTTLRYLAGSDDQSEKMRGLVNSTFAGV